jgi:hypothetical protein
MIWCVNTHFMSAVFSCMLQDHAKYKYLLSLDGTTATAQAAVARLKEDDRLAQNITRTAQGWAAK